jgi:hypothetical protein
MPFSHVLPDNRPLEGVDCEDNVNISEMSLRRLRLAIQNHEVSFPSQVPVFPCQSRADIQWRLVELYFIRNWSCPDLGQRYEITMERVRQLISQWVRRATVLGYLQEIPLQDPALAEPEQLQAFRLTATVSALTAGFAAQSGAQGG